jgi:hypothetical protein
MIYYKPNRTVKPETGSLSYYFKGTVPGKNYKKSTGDFNLFDAATKFYSAVPGNIFRNPMELKNCFALTLAGVIIERLSAEKTAALENRIFSEDFYIRCADDLLQLNSSLSERDLLIIYLKQSVHILEECGIIYTDDNKIVSAEKGLTVERLYRRLFNSFWNELDWKSIFPSSPEAAQSLQENRYPFAELLSGSYSAVSIEVLANDFFEVTGICARNDFFMISFLDFYLLTWLRHFGIVEYSSSSKDGLVYVTLTDAGRTLLKSLS